MEFPLVMSRFAEFSALTGGELDACRPLCRDAAAELSARRLSPGAGEDLLLSAAAALAYYRYCLLQMSGSALPHLGSAALVTEKTLAAAKILCEEYLSAAAPYLASGSFHFGQVTA